MYGRVEVWSSDRYEVQPEAEEAPAFVSLEDTLPEPKAQNFCADHYVTFGDEEACPDCLTAALAVALGLTE